MQKLTKTLGAAGLIGAAGTAGLLGTAEAETIYANGSQSGESHGTGATSATETRDKQALQNYINQLTSEFTWVRTGGAPSGKSATDELRDLQALTPLLRQYDAIRKDIAALTTQGQTLGSTVTVTQNGTVTDAATLRNKLNELNQQITDIRNRLNSIPTTSATGNIQQLIADANKRINEVIDQQDIHPKELVDKITDSKTDGKITGADGSKKKGVVVEFQAQGVSTTSTSGQVETVVVQPTPQAIQQERDKIINEMQNINKANHADADRLRKYQNNGKTNIDNINKWLQEEQTRADNAQSEIAKNSTYQQDFDSYKNDVKKALDDLISYGNGLGNNEAKQRILADANKAKGVIDGSSLTVTKGQTISTNKDVDFGDIGRPTTEVDDIIKQKKSDTDKAVADGMNKLKQATADLNNKLTTARQSATSSITNYKGQIANFITEYNRIQAKNQQTAADNQRKAQSNQQIMQSKGLTYTGNYATDKAAVDAWNKANAGQTGSASGLKATGSTSYSVVNGASKEPPATDVNGKSIFRSAVQAGGAENTDANDSNTFRLTGGSATFRVSGTTHGDVEVTIGNVVTPGYNGSMPYVSFWHAPDGAIAWAVYGYGPNGTVIDGGGGGEGNQGGTGAETGQSGGVFTYVKSYDFTVRTLQNDFTEFTFNDIDNGQVVSFNGLGGGTARVGSKITQSGNSFSSADDGDVSQGSAGQLSSNSMGITYKTPTGINLSGTHTTVDQRFSIVAGIFGNSSMTTVEPIRIEEPGQPEQLPTPPEMTITPINASIETFDIEDPSAKAHGQWKSQLTTKRKQLSTTPPAPNGPKIEVNIPNVVLPEPTDTDNTKKRAASSNSFIVRKLQNDKKRSGAGNSLVVRQLKDKKRSGAGNSLVVREIKRTQRSGAGNSLVVRELRGVQRQVGDVVKPVSAPLRVNKEVVTLNVHVDQSIKPAFNKAVADWAKALGAHGVTLNIQTGNAKLAILDGDNKTTRVARTVDSAGRDNDSAFELTGLAGLTTDTKNIKVVDLDRNDKLNKSGSFTTSDLKRTHTVIQINSDAVKGQENLVNVIKHELGHVFGLVHDDKDKLMTTYFTDDLFTGEISAETASKVAGNLRGGTLCECGICTSARNFI